MIVVAGIVDRAGAWRGAAVALGPALLQDTDTDTLIACDNQEAFEAKDLPGLVHRGLVLPVAVRTVSSDMVGPSPLVFQYPGTGPLAAALSASPHRAGWATAWISGGRGYILFLTQESMKRTLAQAMTQLGRDHSAVANCLASCR